MFYTYVLLSEKDGKHYTGYTQDLKLRPVQLNDSKNQNRRFYLTGYKQHQNGEVESTKHRRPLKLIYYEACLDQEDAMRREKYLKSYHGRLYLAKRLKSYSTRLRD